jgi:hypothetical protein
MVLRYDGHGPGSVWYDAVMWVVMSAAEREEFLADVRVGVVSVAVDTAGRTLAVPVWYSYQPGGLLTVLTDRRSRSATARPTDMSASRGRLSARKNSIPLSDLRWPAAT